MPKLLINGIELYYELQGQGPPLVLIAGYTCDSTQWNLVIAELARHHQVLIFDNRDAGRSGLSPTPYYLEELANDTMDLVERLGLQKPHILGHSMGGAIAQIIGVRYGQAISKLILCNTLLKIKPASALALRFQLGLRRDGISPRRLMEGILPWVFSNAMLSSHENIVRCITQLLRNPHPPTLEGTHRQLDAIMAADSSDWFTNIDVPTLVITSEEDLLCPPEDARQLAAGIPGARLFSFPHMGHVPMLEKPAAFNRLVLDFLAS